MTVRLIRQEQHDEVIRIVKAALAEIEADPHLTQILMVAWRGDLGWTHWLSGDVSCENALGKLRIIEQSLLNKYFEEAQSD